MAPQFRFSNFLATLARDGASGLHFKKKLAVFIRFLNSFSFLNSKPELNKAAENGSKSETLSRKC